MAIIRYVNYRILREIFYIFKNFCRYFSGPSFTGTPFFFFFWHTVQCSTGTRWPGMYANAVCSWCSRYSCLVARCALVASLNWLLSVTQQNSYSISHLLGTVTTQWLPLWRCSHCSLVPDTVTIEQWLHRTHTLLGIPYCGTYVEICLLGT